MSIAYKFGPPKNPPACSNKATIESTSSGFFSPASVSWDGRHCKHCKKYCCSCVHVSSRLNEVFLLTPVPHRADRSTVHTPPCLCVTPISGLGHTLLVSDATRTSGAQLFCCSPWPTFKHTSLHVFHAGFHLVFLCWWFCSVLHWKRLDSVLV